MSTTSNPAAIAPGLSSDRSAQEDASVERSLRWHLVTPEYPPQLGGVSDYTGQLAAGLSGRGDEVHVWCPSLRSPNGGKDSLASSDVHVHREFGKFAPADLRAVGNQLDSFPAPRHLLVQWVPHGYGYRSMNLGFCWWLWKRATRCGDHVELMVHEPFLTFDWTSPRQSAAALVHRSMITLLLRAASRVWISIPGWERILRVYALGREVGFQWLPIFATIPAASDLARTQAVKRRYADGGRILIGHFGTYASPVGNLLEPILSALAHDPVEQTILLMGERSDQYRLDLIQKEPGLENVIRATGKMSAEDLSHHLSACDLLVQPYPDGVSTRRTSFMAGLINAKPMVTTTGWLTEPFWFQSEAVALAPAGDTEAFLEQARRIRNDSTERMRLGSAASALYQERFDLSRTISSLRKAKTAKGYL